MQNLYVFKFEKNMNISEFNFDLPKELIAQYPCTPRSASRLLYLAKDIGKITHKTFNDLPDFLLPNDLLIFNDTRVIPARLFGNKITGGKVEILIERLLNKNTGLVHIKSNTTKIGTKVIIADYLVEVIGRKEAMFILRVLNGKSLMNIMEEVGHIPLPPYINRVDETVDKERYQTIFAKNKGAVAAPTAALHFDEELIKRIKNNGVQVGFVTLHVGAGTFQPIRVENILEHKMHSEYVEVSPLVCEQIREAKKKGGRIIAVGTTSLRSLETAAKNGNIYPYKGETDIFIYQGFNFSCIDGLVTNFHLPKSSLMLLVCAFAGYRNIMNAYQEAIGLSYRFFSYGDGMFII